MEIKENEKRLVAVCDPCLYPGPSPPKQERKEGCYWKNWRNLMGIRYFYCIILNFLDVMLGKCPYC